MHRPSARQILEPAVPRVGRREEAKQQRFDKIMRAARELFLKKGYDATTMRAIAKRADVGLGTIFRYVEDKRDLMFLLFNEDHRAVTQRVLDDVPHQGGFIDQLEHVIRHFYAYYAAQPEFARSALKEITFYIPGRATERLIAPRYRVMALFRQIIGAARARREIQCDEDDAMLAYLIYDIYMAECERWLLEPKPRVETGVAILMRSLNVLSEGLRSRSRKRRVTR